MSEVAVQQAAFDHLFEPLENALSQSIETMEKEKRNSNTHPDGINVSHTELSDAITDQAWNRDSSVLITATTI
jgi:hypothetical protein